MFTAQQVYQAATSKQVIEGLDKWIEDYLVGRFTERGLEPVGVNYKTVAGKGWLKEGFMRAMELRGFKVDYKCDDRPCSDPYYEIRIPPQGE